MSNCTAINLRIPKPNKKDNVVLTKEMETNEDVIRKLTLLCTII